ncbi:MAG: hypothetical protein AAB152_10075 [Candidatus Coatesbacteria bacterium]
MSTFPRTTVGGVSVSRMIIGTNWFLGFSHTTAAKDNLIKSTMDARKVADVIEVFLNAGVDTIMGLHQWPVMRDAVKEAQQRTGKKLIVVSTPHLPVTPETPAQGLDLGEVAKILDAERALGTTFCFPHGVTVDALLDRCTRQIRHLPPVMKMIRERGLIPGLSTHMPESVIYADESGLDVETYIQLYNSMGFLMQVEVDWIANVIRNAKKPVMTIKPFAAGQLRPFQALHFVWNTLRDQDMVTVGTMTPDEAKECVELSLAILERRKADVTLQETRSKGSIKPRA